MKRLEVEFIIPFSDRVQEEALVSAVRRFKEHVELIMPGIAFKSSAHVKEGRTYSLDDDGSPYIKPKLHRSRADIQKQQKETANQRLRDQGIEPKEGQTILNNVNTIVVDEEDGNPG